MIKITDEMVNAAAQVIFEHYWCGEGMDSGGAWDTDDLWRDGKGGDLRDGWRLVAYKALIAALGDS